MSFFAKACVEALKKFPAVNASVEATTSSNHGIFRYRVRGFHPIAA